MLPENESLNSTLEPKNTIHDNVLKECISTKQPSYGSTSSSDAVPLRNICENAIQERLNIKNAVDMLFLASLYGLTKLKAEALSLITKNKEILKQSKTVKRLKNNPDMKDEVMKAVFDKNPVLVAELAMEGSALFN